MISPSKRFLKRPGEAVRAVAMRPHSASGGCFPNFFHTPCDRRAISARNFKRLRVPVAALALWMSLALERQAHAYIDPGAGAFMWQMILSSLVGSLFVIRRARQWLHRQLLRLIGKAEPPQK